MRSDRAQDSPQQGIQSIEVGSKVLLALEAGRGPLALSEVAERSGMHPSKVHRYLVSLVRVGLASRDVSTGLYDLGPAARHLGVEALRRTDAVSTASAYAVELRDETGHTVHVAVWSDAGPLIVRWDTGAHALPITVRVGSTLPLLDSAVGHVFLTYLPKRTTSEVLKTQQRQSETRALHRTEVDAIIEGVREARFGRVLNQMIFGIAALAAPVFAADGALELVLGVALPSRMLTAAEVRRLGPLLRSTADRISQELGLSVEALGS
jgi:DNA-binding IclR family transcriptional regulator